MIEAYLHGPLTPSSSWVLDYGYGTTNDGQEGLIVTFKSGVSVIYHDTTEADFEAMDAAPSKGKFLHGTGLAALGIGNYDFV